MTISFTIRFEEDLIDKIDAYCKLKEISKSEAMRNLIEIGLNIEALKNDNIDELTEDRDKIMIEMWFALAKIFSIIKEDSSDEDLKKVSTMSKNTFSKRFQNMFESYKKSLFSDDK